VTTAGFVIYRFGDLAVAQIQEVLGANSLVQILGAVIAIGGFLVLLLGVYRLVRAIDAATASAAASVPA
jgi:uncharacterized membrane protein YidH (DUF202 family)